MTVNKNVLNIADSLTCACSMSVTWLLCLTNERHQTHANVHVRR